MYRSLLLALILAAPAAAQSQHVTGRVRIIHGESRTEVASSLAPLPVAIARAPSQLSDEDTVHKFGYNGAVANGANEIISNLSAASYGGWLQAATTVRVKAGGNASDVAAGAGAEAVEIIGLDENWLDASESVATAGTSASAATTTTFIRVFRAKAEDIGTYHSGNVGDITIENSGGGTDLIKIDADQSQSEHAAYTIPADKVGYLDAIHLFVEGTKEVTVFLRVVENADVFSTPYSANRSISRYAGLTGNVSIVFTQTVKLPPKTDVWLEALGPVASAAISANFDITLKPLNP